MDNTWKPLEGNPLSRIFLIEFGILILFILLSFLVFGFGYGEQSQGRQQISYPGVINLGR